MIKKVCALCMVVAVLCASLVVVGAESESKGLTQDMVNGDIVLTDNIDNLYCCGTAFNEGFKWIKPDGECVIDMNSTYMYDEMNFKVSYEACGENTVDMAEIQVICDGEVIFTKPLYVGTINKIDVNIAGKDMTSIKVITHNNSLENYSKLTVGDIEFK